MIVLIKVLQVILALSVLIIIHELGHFTFAKLFGIRVDKFFLFFDIKGVKLFSTRSAWFRKLVPSSEKWETEYGIGWLPLGGYCKIAGMVDESMDMESLKKEPQEWEFRTKAAWKRLLVMAGGVMYNFIFAIAAYVAILAIWGESYIANEGNSVMVSELAYEMGFRDGDMILSFDDYVPDNFSMLQADLARRNVKVASVLRDNDTVRLYIDHSMIGEVLNTPDMFALAVPFEIQDIPQTSVNHDSGLMPGDRIVAFDSVQVRFVQQARPVLDAKAGDHTTALVLRGRDSLLVDLQVDSLGMIGVQMVLPGIRTREYSVLEAVPAGAQMAWSTVVGYLRDLRLVATPSTGAYKSVGSFISIGQVFPSAWDWYQFISIVALLSIMLGVMNLLPIPGLDGGHILFTLFEMLTGKKPSDSFLAVAQMVGMFLLILLMFLAFGNDISRLF